MTERTTRTKKETRAEARPKRIPLSGAERNILGVINPDPSKVYRWVNDTPGRIDRFLAAWWEFAPPGVMAGERKADTAASPDSTVSKKVGADLTAYLMCIDKEYYEQDRKAAAELVDKTEESLFRKINEQQDEGYENYGNVTF